MGMRDGLRFVETVSGREYEPGPKRVLLRFEDWVMCVGAPAKGAMSLFTYAVSGARRAAKLAASFSNSASRFSFRLRLRLLQKNSIPTRSAMAPV
jgi:hypothetical protein